MRLIPILLFILLCAGCGSGGGGSSAPSTQADDWSFSLIEIQYNASTLTWNDQISLSCVPRCPTKGPGTYGEKTQLTILNDLGVEVYSELKDSLNDFNTNFLVSPANINCPISGGNYTAKFFIDPLGVNANEDRSNNIQTRSLYIIPNISGTYVLHSNEITDVHTAVVSSTSVITFSGKFGLGDISCSTPSSSNVDRKNFSISVPWIVVPGQYSYRYTITGSVMVDRTMSYQILYDYQAATRLAPVITTIANFSGSPANNG